MVKAFKVKINKINNELEKKLIALLAPDGYYGNYDINLINDLSDKYSINSNLLISLRSQILKNKVIKKHYLIKKHKLNIISQYRNTNILDLTKKYDIAPLTIMRLIIKDKYKFKISKNNQNKLDKYDRNQLDLALNNDITSQIDQDQVLDESIKYEQKIKRALKKKNVNFKTQEDLANEQKKEFGYAKITPDFLFDDVIEINGEKIKWMEIKNFYGSNIKYFKNKIKKQVDKYYKKWGKGCIVFRYGFNNDIRFGENMIISF